jgi:SAM-dependent methyltransferase
MPFCPVCRSESHSIVNELTSHEVANSHLLANATSSRFGELKAHLETLWGDDRVRVYACPNCELCFADPFKAGDIDFYELASYDTPYPAYRWEFDETLRALRKKCPDDTSVLEVGAGKGYFLDKLVESDYQRDNLLALEFSSVGKEEIERKGICCLQDDLRGVRTGKKYDVVCMFQVLEHLDNYRELFDALARVTNAHADLFISVPNGERISHNEANGFLLDTPPNHITRWTPKSVTMLADRYGWSVNECKLEPASSKVAEMRYSLVNRFVRKAQQHGSYANRISVLASRLKDKRKARLVKAFGALTSVDAILAALRSLHKELIGHTLWVHLKK